MTKKILTLLFSVIILVIPTYGQLSKNITVNTPGTLESQLWTDKAKVTDLVLTGTINSADFTTIKQMTLLKVLDMSNVNIIDGKIPASAFANRNMTKLILPASLKIVGDNSFAGMSVSSLDFSSCLTLEELGNQVFAGFKSNTGILDFSKNKSLTRFLKEGQSRWGTFTGCGEHVILPINMTVLPPCTFYGFKGSVDLPLVLEDISYNSFTNSSLTKGLILPASLKRVQNNAFSGMTTPSLDFSACINLEELGEQSFNGFKSNLGILDFSKNKSLTRFLKEGQNRWGTFTGCGEHVILPTNMTVLPPCTFYGFKGSVELPQAIETISFSSFSNSVLTKGLVLPSSLKKVEDNAFSGVSAPSLDFSASINLEELGNNIFNGFKSNLGVLDFSTNKSLTRFLREGMGRWGTFTNCNQHVILPVNLTAIPSCSFYGFKGSITFSPVLETIGESAFANSVLTKGIVFPNSLKTIGTKAFYNSTIPSVSFEQMDPSQSGVSCF